MGVFFTQADTSSLMAYKWSELPCWLQCPFKGKKARMQKYKKSHRFPLWRHHKHQPGCSTILRYAQFTPSDRMRGTL